MYFRSMGTEEKKLQSHVALVLYLAVLVFESCDGSVFVTDPVTSIVIELSRNYPYCQVHNDSEAITELLTKYPKRFSVVNSESLYKMEGPCESREKYGFIYPGTLWCGRGTKAIHYAQLGVHSKEDSCCREHDNCPKFLAAGECRGDVCNTSSFTRSHCDCDKKFQECLRNTNTETGNTIGAIFFNIAQIICFKETKDCVTPGRLPVQKNNEVTNEDSCPLEFVATEKYIPSEAHFTFKNKKAFFLNIFLKKFRLLRK